MTEKLMLCAMRFGRFPERFRGMTEKQQLFRFYAHYSKNNAYCLKIIINVDNEFLL